MLDWSDVVVEFSEDEGDGLGEGDGEGEGVGIDVGIVGASGFGAVKSRTKLTVFER